MKYRVEVHRRATRDYESILAYIADRSKTGATAWANAFRRTLSRLEDFADTMALAEEDDLVDFEVREVLFKTRRGLTYRVLFTITGQVVQILHVRGPGQDFLSPDEIAGPD